MDKATLFQIKAKVARLEKLMGELEVIQTWLDHGDDHDIGTYAVVEFFSSSGRDFKITVPEAVVEEIVRAAATSRLKEIAMGLKDPENQIPF